MTTEETQLQEEIALLRSALASANAKIQAARADARRRVMEHASHHPESRTYTISELTLEHWGLR